MQLIIVFFVIVYKNVFADFFNLRVKNRIYRNKADTGKLKIFINIHD